MLAEIGSKDKVPAFVKEVKESGGEVKLMGFGHRVYKNYDPRAKVIKQMADKVFEVTGRNPLLDIALELERIALSDEYFVKRKLYPNVDFYSGLIYQAMGFPVDMFPVLFAIGRMSGWLAQWQEMVDDKEQKIARPRQVYLGADERPYRADDPALLRREDTCARRSRSSAPAASARRQPTSSPTARSATSCWSTSCPTSPRARRST